jgi:hypothetical protein
MTSERLLSILRFNSWGSLHSELGVTEARKEKLHSLIGELACCLPSSACLLYTNADMELLLVHHWLAWYHHRHAGHSACQLRWQLRHLHHQRLRTGVLMVCADMLWLRCCTGTITSPACKASSSLHHLL